MKPALLALSTLGLLAQPAPPARTPQPPATPAVDGRDRQPLLLGPTTPEAILAHREVFKVQTGRVVLSPALKARWQALRQPCTLVAVFGSWCGDSQEQLPQLLALGAEPNAFVEVVYLGVDRDKQVPPAAWPKGCAPQAVVRVPTFYLFVVQPGGALRLAGTVVETPPREGQTMAEALLDLLEASAPVP